MAKKRKRPAAWSNARLIDELLTMALEHGDIETESFEPTISGGAAALAVMDKYVLQLAQYVETEGCVADAEIPVQPPQLLTHVWERFAAISNEGRFTGSHRATIRRAKRRMSELGMRAASMLEQLGEDY